MVKCTLVHALRLCAGRTALMGSRGIALLFHDHGTSRGWSGQRHAPAALYSRERPGTHCTGGWVGPRAVWTGVENLAPTGIRSPDRPGRSQSLYRLHYPANSWAHTVLLFCCGRKPGRQRSTEKEKWGKEENQIWGARVGRDKGNRLHSVWIYEL